MTETAVHETSVHDMDWAELAGTLDRTGYAVTPPVLGPEECAALVALYDRPEPWRSRVDMARHRFGSGEYQYFANPLPDTVAALREAFYPHLVPVANRWNELLRFPDQFPDRLADYLDRCHGAGQTKPTPLMLRYRAGDYNCLHRDIYGEEAFPLQVMVALSQVVEDYDGGEFLLVEILPRA